MPVATPIVGVNAKVTFTLSGGSEITLKNSNWQINPKNDVKEAPNTTDGMLRAPGLNDYSGNVKGYTDTTNPIEASIAQGAIGLLKLYRNSTKFFSLTVIIGDFTLETGVDGVETWTFNWMLQSGSLTLPV